ncbi:MAG: DUF6226 family protein [Geodermatophilaceae bacterium]
MADIDDGPPWGVDGPPDETYSRITRDLASIYAPLAPAAEAALQRLVREYDVTAHEVLEAERARFSRTTRAVALVPSCPGPPTLTLGWTDLPGLTVRLGDSEMDAVPPGGCDACSKSVKQCLAQFEELIGAAIHAWWGIRRAV